METYEGMRRQVDQTPAAKAGRRAHQDGDARAPKFESNEQELEYQRIVREYYSLLARAKAGLSEYPLAFKQRAKR
jgi:hypothetical protein